MSNRLSLTLLAASAVIAPIAMIATACATPAIDTHSDLTRHACAPGTEIVVWYWQSTPCDLDGTQTLTELGLTEAQCDQVGGHWVYEACEDRDY